MMISEFDSLKNLAFYPGFNTHFVYFKSLLDYTSDSIAYENARIRVLKNIDASTSNFLKQDDFKKGMFRNYSSKMLECRNFLRKAVAYETANEQAYFTQMLKNLKSTFSEKEQELSQVQNLINLFENNINETTGKVEYKNFLAAINILMQGIKNTKAIITYEKKRIEDIDDALLGMKQRREKQLYGLAETLKMDPERTQRMLKESLEKQEKKIDAYYIKNKNYKSKRNQKGQIYERLTGASVAFKKIPKSVAVELSDWINKQLNNIFKNDEVVKTITEYITLNNILVPNYLNHIEHFVKSVVLQALVDQAQTHLSEILNKQYRNIPKKKIIEELEKSINITQSYGINGIFQNFGTSGRHLKGFENMNKDFDLHEASAEEFTLMFTRFQKAVRDNYPLTDVQNNLYEFMVKENIYDKFDELIKLINQLKKVEKTISTAEKRIEHFLQKNTQTINVNLGKSAYKGLVKVKLTITPNEVIFDGFEEGLKSTRAFQEVFGEDSKMTITSVKNAISEITRNASKMLKETLANSVDRAISEVSNTEAYELKYQLNTMIRDGLQNLKIRATGPELSEVLAAINFTTNDRGKITVNKSGQTKIKNDVITISIDRENFHLSTNFEKLIQQQTDHVADLIASYASNDEIEDQLAVNVVSTFQNVTAKNFARNANAQSEKYTKNMKAFLNQYFLFSEGLRNISDDYIKILDDWDAYKQKLIKQETDADTIKQKYINMMTAIEDSFYVSTTVKTYDQYTNKLGFGGGSLGGNLEAQLANICDVFEIAGCPMSKSDQEWLYYSIINCADTTLQGRRNAPKIEQYLGSMAAFMLFDEGGAEIKILNNLTNDLQKIENLSSPKILHLYNVNGIYVPGSYVLRQVEQTLDNCDITFTKVVDPDYQGAGIRIINPMNEGMIPNRGKTSRDKLDYDPWGTIAKIAKKSVSVEIFFLAGLLDTINQINEAMGNITLPA